MITAAIVNALELLLGDLHKAGIHMPSMEGAMADLRSAIEADHAYWQNEISSIARGSRTRGEST